MNVNTAEEIIDNMYQKRMSQMEEKTNEGLIIHLGTKVEFTTKEEEASVIILRELQILRRKLANSIPISVIQNTLKEINKKEKEELKGLKGQDRYFVKQMYQYMRKPLQELLEERNK